MKINEKNSYIESLVKGRDIVSIDQDPHVLDSMCKFSDILGGHHFLARWINFCNGIGENLSTWVEDWTMAMMQMVQVSSVGVKPQHCHSNRA